MKLLLAICSVMLAAAGFADGEKTFITPEMTYRRGLTDEQYEALWKIGRKPTIEPAAAREWMFKGMRFSNTTNWLAIVGRTNDFARLSSTLSTENLTLHDVNDALRDTNSVLVVEIKQAKEIAEAAEYDAEITRSVRKATKRAEKNLEKVIKEMEKAKKKSTTDEETALWTMLINLLNGIDPNTGV